MSTLEIVDAASLDLFYAKRVLLQMFENHSVIHIKEDEQLSKAQEYEYGRQYKLNAALIEIALEKIEHASKVIQSQA